MAQGNQYDYVPGYDYANNIQQMGMYYWDTGALSYVRWSGSSTTPDVAIANFPAVSTITGTVTATAPAITTVSYATPWFLFASQSGSYGISWNIGATQSGVWNVGINTGSQVAIASVNGNVGISGNVGATQSGVWNVGINSGSQVAIASVNGNIGISGNVGATQSGVWNVGVNSGAQIAIASGTGLGISGSVVASLSGTNYIIATLSTGSAIVGGVYPVSGLVMNERAQIVPGSISFGNATTTGYITLAAAQGSGVFIRVLAGHCMSTGYNAVALFSGVNGTGSTISSTKPVAPYGGWVWPFNPQGWCETGANQALSFYQSVATDTGIDVTWATFN